MTMLAGRNMGYRFAVFDPSPECCAAQIADYVFTAPYDDEAALTAFADCCNVITYEFENVSAVAAQVAGFHKPLHPSHHVLLTSQHRILEKLFLSDNGFPVALFMPVQSGAELATALEQIGTPSVLKTATEGYDGKGQIKIDSANIDPEAIWEQLGCGEAVLEQWISFERECSVIVARNEGGEVEVFPVAENQHSKHILDFSIIPARLSEASLEQAQTIARNIASALNLVGVLAVEFFVTEDGSVLVNELAPRPHNSGHYTMDACSVSQFEQHVRAICGLPLGNPMLRRPVVMANLLGEVWQNGTPNWPGLLAEPDCHLHLYDKGRPQTGRKMGHFNLLGDSTETILERAQLLRRSL